MLRTLLNPGGYMEPFSPLNSPNYFSPKHFEHSSGLKWRHLKDIEKRVRRETTLLKLATYNLSEMEAVPTYRGPQHRKQYEQWAIGEVGASDYSEAILTQLCQGMVAWSLSVGWGQKARDALMGRMVEEHPPEITAAFALDETATPHEIEIRTEILKEAAVLAKVRFFERAKRIRGALETIASMAGKYYDTQDYIFNVLGLHHELNTAIADATAVWAKQRVRSRFVLALYQTRVAVLQLRQALKEQRTFTGSPCLTRRDKRVIEAAVLFLQRWHGSLKKIQRSGVPFHVMGCLPSAAANENAEVMLSPIAKKAQRIFGIRKFVPK